MRPKEQAIDKKDMTLLVIDPQEKLMPYMDKKDDLINNLKKLVKAFNIMKIPIILTEQYPRGLGNTVKELKGELKDFDYIEKLSFDCFGEDGFAKKISSKTIAVCGIEAHVCVLQTALSALSRGFDVHVVADAVSSRRDTDCSIALRRMEQEGARLATAEMLILQLLKRAGAEGFKEIQKIIK